jgi:16S rRNA (uracil1498-N3)-methyltransferase
MAVHRFFVPPEVITTGTVSLEGPLAHQIANVLRLRPGDRICLLDNSGWEVEVELGPFPRKGVAGKVVRRSLATSEPRTKITVYQALLKADKFEFVLQKCTELGAVGFVPLITSRTVLGAVGEADSPRRQRWQRIIVEAAEQSGRGRLPLLHPAELLQSACEGASGLSLIPWEGERVFGLRAVLREHFAAGEKGHARPFSVNLFIGPEGGFAEAEVQLARRHGAIPVSLGPRVLRAETAAVVATAAVLYEAADLGA